MAVTRSGYAVIGPARGSSPGETMAETTIDPKLADTAEASKAA
jgi:hypothetical protein